MDPNFSKPHGPRRLGVISHPRKSPCPSPPPPPPPGPEAIKMGNTPRESPAPHDRPTATRLPTHRPPIDSSRALTGPRRPEAGSPDARAAHPRGGKSRTKGTPRHRGGGSTRLSSARGPRRVGTPRALTPLLTRARPPARPAREAPLAAVGLRASAIRPPNSRPARTLRRPGAGEGRGASSGAGGRKRGGRKMARNARA